MTHKQLLALRKKLGVTQKTMALMFGFKTHTIYKMEAGLLPVSKRIKSMAPYFKKMKKKELNALLTDINLSEENKR